MGNHRWVINTQTGPVFYGPPFLFWVWRALVYFLYEFLSFVKSIMQNADKMTSWGKLYYSQKSLLLFIKIFSLLDYHGLVDWSALINFWAAHIFLATGKYYKPKVNCETLLICNFVITVGATSSCVMWCQWWHSRSQSTSCRLCWNWCWLYT